MGQRENNDDERKGRSVMVQGTLNVSRDRLGIVTAVSFTERDDMGDWQVTVFDCGLTGMTLDWGRLGTVEVRPVQDALWGRAVEELFLMNGWNAVGPYVVQLGFAV